ncbi:hypothetical protein LDENG_00019710, partial [Lucifuga dentata]
DEPDIANTAVALLTTVSENTTGPIDFSPASIAIVVEDDIVVSDLHEMADAFVLLFGLMYALHLDYPKKLIHTFTFTQTVIMGITCCSNTETSDNSVCIWINLDTRAFA